MKIALAFWGITRSLKYTIDSIKDNILGPLNSHDVTVFLHTFTFSGDYTNPRAKEVGLHLDFKEYTLLNADVIEITDQDELKREISIDSFKTNKDPWNTNYISVENFICAMYSKSRIVDMIEKSSIQFDRIIFLRPDVQYLNLFDNKFLDMVDDSTICVPNFHKYSNFNDRFCIATHKNGLIYGSLFKFMLEYSKINELHSETFQRYYLDKIFKLKILFIPIYFNRVRANGIILNDCPDIK